MQMVTKPLMEGFDILKFFGNATEYLKQIGGYVVILVGVVLLIVAIVQIGKGLAGGGKGQVNWVASLSCLLIGGALMFGGWNLVTNLASTGADTINNLGGGSGMTADDDGWNDGGKTGFGK